MNAKRNAPERGKDTETSIAEPSTNQEPRDLHPDQELVYRVKSAIDQRGRYSFRLSDMAAGFASGKSVSHTTARQTIEKRFAEQLGLSPQEYLDRHYDERRQQGLDGGRSRQRTNGQERSR